MGSKTKIDWCDSTWNPVTGCLHGCEYCYARRIAKRFDGRAYLLDSTWVCAHNLECESGKPCMDCNHVLDKPIRCADLYSHMRMAGISAGKVQPYPYGFMPTFHRYKLDEPLRWKKPRTIFVCSMSDLFGDWVPDEWIEQVFEACEAAPRHRYLFLTKNPKRYVELYRNGILRVRDSFWYGSTITNANDPFYYSRMPDDNPHTFCSIEPILEPIGIEPLGTMRVMPDWVIVGAETGSRKDKVAPQKEWIDEIAIECERRRTPIFMKESLRDLMGSDFRQEFPWEVKQ